MFGQPSRFSLSEIAARWLATPFGTTSSRRPSSRRTGSDAPRFLSVARRPPLLPEPSRAATRQQASFNEKSPKAGNQRRGLGTGSPRTRARRGTASPYNRAATRYVFPRKDSGPKGLEESASKCPPPTPQAATLQRGVRQASRLGGAGTRRQCTAPASRSSAGGGTRLGPIAGM